MWCTCAPNGAGNVRMPLTRLRLWSIKNKLDGKMCAPVSKLWAMRTYILETKQFVTLVSWETDGRWRKTMRFSLIEHLRYLKLLKLQKKLELNSPNWSQCTVKYVCLRCKTDCFVKYFDKASSLKG